MSKYTKLSPFSTTFDGDTVTMKLGRLSTANIMQLMPYFTDDGDGNLKFQLTQAIEISQVASEFLPNYVHEFSGLKDSDGNVVPLEEAMGTWYFNALMSEIMVELMRISSPAQREVDQLGKP